MWAGMSSGPSSVCVHPRKSSGTAASNHVSKSRAHVGRGVLVERQRRRGVADEEVAEADLELARARAARARPRASRGESRAGRGSSVISRCSHIARDATGTLRAMSLLLISGSLRDGSTNTALLRTAQAIDADTELFAAHGRPAALQPRRRRRRPPGRRRRPARRRRPRRGDPRLHSRVRRARCRARSRISWSGWSAAARPTASRSPGSTSPGPAAPSGGADAHDSLRKVVGYISMEIVEEACVRIPVLATIAVGERIATRRSASRRALAAVSQGCREGAAWEPLQSTAGRRSAPAEGIEPHSATPRARALGQLRSPR